MHDILSRHYSKSATFTCINPPMAVKFTQLPVEKRNAIKLLKGHQPFGMDHYFETGTTEYFTLLREPVDRVVSHYYHLRTDSKHPFHAEFHEKNYTLVQLLESGKILNMNNCMVRLLSGNYNCAYDTCTTAMLDQALANLRLMPVVGLQTQFDFFLLRLGERYGFNQLYYRRKRVSKARVPVSALDAETEACIRHYNQLDLALYAIMKPEIEQVQAALLPDFQARLERFQRLNLRYNKWASWVGLGWK